LIQIAPHGRLLDNPKPFALVLQSRIEGEALLQECVGNLDGQFGERDDRAMVLLDEFLG
jgi:hypothetical protein